MATTKRSTPTRWEDAVLDLATLSGGYRQGRGPLGMSITGGSTGFWEQHGEKSRQLSGMCTKGPMAGMPDWTDVRPSIIPRSPRQPKPSSGLDAYSRRAARALRRGGDDHAIVGAARAIGPVVRDGLGEGDDDTFVAAITPPRPRPLGSGGSEMPPTFRQGVDPS